jgi:SAM-dependent methyltransferase
MERKYWEKIAPDYNEEIFDVLHNDKKAVIRSVIRRVASAQDTVIDAGCAVGKWLPVLSPLFKNVIAVDISAKNIAIAKKNYSALMNIDYLRADLSSPSLRLPKADVVVCINAILSASMQKRTHFFSHLSRCLNNNGKLVLVVPSMESWLTTRVIQRRWNIDPSLFRDKLSVEEAAKRYRSLQEGNVEIDNVATKHYMEGELELLLTREGFEPERCRKIQYSWDTEFIDAPRWLKQPRPWDWLVVAQKIK